MTPGLTIYAAVVAFIFGTVFGSFINCLAGRNVRHESALKGRSHCDACGHVLGPADLVPVFSYVFLKGRCRYCGAKISPRCLVTELLNGTVFAVLAVRFLPDLVVIRYLVLVCVLLALSLVDLDTFEIPDGYILFGIIWWAGTIPLAGGSLLRELISGAIGGALIGGGMLVLSLIFDRVTGKESLGGGDIKLFFMVSLYLGPWKGLFNLILSCIIGLIFAVLRRKNRIPFGPAISLASVFTILFGDAFIAWYGGLLGF